MSTRTIYLLVGTFLVLFWGAFFYVGSVALGAGRCDEDQPCWTWSTMGNHKRAVATLDGDWHRVVGPCTFSRLAHGGYIDWARTPRLRGDTTARRMRCPNYRPIRVSEIF